MKPQVGKREEKKTLQRMEIVQVFVKALESEDLIHLKVQDLCDAIGISKVTFFKYFESKESVLLHYTSTWLYLLTYEIGKNKLQGIDAIRRVFQAVGGAGNSQHVMNGILHHFIKQENYHMPILTDIERYLISPEAFEAGVRRKSIRVLIEDGLEVLVADQEDRKRLFRVLEAGFYGVALRSKIRDSSLQDNYGEFVDTVLEAYL